MHGNTSRNSGSVNSNQDSPPSTGIFMITAEYESTGGTMLRFIIVCIIVGGFLIFSIPLLLIEWVIGKFAPHVKDISSLRIVQGVFKLVLWVTGADITVIGQENVPKDEALLFIGNHRSFFDILITYTRCRNVTGYVAKKEMLKIPLLNFWMMYLHCLFLDRTNLKEGLKTILKGIEELKNGISICIFPEGTRGTTDNELTMLPFHEGSFKLATKTNCPIIPMALCNTAEIFEAQFPRIKPCHVILEYGRPIIPSELSKDEVRHIGVYTQEIIKEMLQKNISAV